METLTAKELALYLGQSCHYKYRGEILSKEIDLQILEGAEFLDVKPILRPLSDASEEEQDECERIRLEMGERFKLGAEVTAAVTVYLLSRGFDLFNWIEQGLAISKTKQLI